MLGAELPLTNVVGRALRVLDALAGDFRSDLMIVSERTGLSKPTVHRILNDLMRARPRRVPTISQGSTDQLI